MRAAAIPLVLALVACGPGGEGAAGKRGRVAESPPIPRPDPAFPREVVDGTGRVLRLAAPPRRIVSQTLGSDEVLIDLVAPERLVGVSPLARDPSYSNIAGRFAPGAAPAVTSAEDVLRLRPDLVIVASYSRAEVVQLLEASGAPVYRLTSFDRLQDVKDNVRRLGRLVGEDAKADALVRDMDARLAAIAARRSTGSRPRVLSYSPGGFTAAAGTLFDDIVRHAGAENEAARQGLQAFPRISAEQVLAWDPDFLVAGHMHNEGDMVRRQLLANPAVAATRAARAGRLVLLDNRSLLAVSPFIVDAVEALANALGAATVRGGAAP